MEDIIKELRIMNQRLSNLEFEVEKVKESRKDLSTHSESFREELQEHKLEIAGHLNIRFEDDSFARSSRDFQQRDNLPSDVALNNLNSGDLAGTSKLMIYHYFSRMII